MGTACSSSRCRCPSFARGLMSSIVWSARMPARVCRSSRSRPRRLHRAWVAELSRRFPGSVRVFAPSETAAARAQLGSRRFKTDDRDCAALTYLARQGGGRTVPGAQHEALLAAVRARRAMVGDRKVAQQRLHDQVNALCPGLSAPPGHGRKLDLFGVTGQAVLDCLIAFEARPVTARSLIARASVAHPGGCDVLGGPLEGLSPPPGDGLARVERLERAVARWRR